jgi:hypothetical protein
MVTLRMPNSNYSGDRRRLNRPEVRAIARVATNDRSKLFQVGMFAIFLTALLSAVVR